MGTVVARKRGDGTIGYSARVMIQVEGHIHRESKTFDRQAAANSWLRRREAELSEPGALHKVDDPPLSAVIERYITESKRELGATKTQVLRTIKRDLLADMNCSEIGSAQLLAFAQRLSCKPQTVQNYLSHLGAIFAIARPAWGYPLDQQAIKDAFVVGRRMGVTGKSVARDRRPTIEELDKLMENFGQIRHRRVDSIPMQKLVAFALYSTRRLNEILTIRWADLETGRVLVRDLKHPGQKIGNNVWCDLPPEAEAIARSAQQVDDRIFPYGHDAVGASFTRACKLLAIEDLHLHDLRHHGVSRLFEMGNSIPHVAAVSGHRSWASLKRYTHLRQRGDCMEGWHGLQLAIDCA